MSKKDYEIVKVVVYEMTDIREQQKLFVDEYLRLRKRSQKQAAINAGYSAKSADAQASQLMKNPKVMKYLNERESQLESELRKEFMFDALEARKVMYEIMNDAAAPENVRVSAAKDFLDRAGFKPVEKQEHSGQVTQNINNMTNLTEDELRKIAEMSDD